jgi:hypothetical protein
MRRQSAVALILLVVSLPCSGAHSFRDAINASPFRQNRQVVDRVAVRIEGDIITESELRELEAFQNLVDGHAKSRNEVTQELVDQWIARGEAKANQYPPPSSADIDRAFSQ